jgi:hypothetical protein
MVENIERFKAYEKQLASFIPEWKRKNF